MADGYKMPSELEFFKKKCRTHVTALLETHPISLLETRPISILEKHLLYLGMFPVYWNTSLNLSLTKFKTEILRFKKNISTFCSVMEYVTKKCGQFRSGRF